MECCFKVMKSDSHGNAEKQCCCCARKHDPHDFGAKKSEPGDAGKPESGHDHSH